MSQIRGDDNLRRDAPRSGKSRADGRGFIIGLFGVIPSGFARAISAPIPYDQLSGFHFGLVVVAVPMAGAMVGSGQRQEHLLLKPSQK